jgi:nucleotide-binding universal stress UspA family protein
MFKKIVMGIDREGLAAGAIPVVVTLARRSGAEVVVVHVRDIENELRSREDAAEVLDTAVGELTAHGVHATGEIRSIADRHPARAIARAAEEHGADLVAVGSHGRTDLAAMLLGSVGHEVATLVSVPVLVVRPPDGSAWLETAEEAPLSRILLAVALDEPDSLFRTTAEVALPQHAKVRVLHVKESVALAEGAAYIEPEADAGAAIANALARLARLGIEAESEVATGIGSVAHEVVDAAERWGADLVVLGSRRPSDVGGLILGSIGHQVIHMTRRPVLLAEAAPKAATERVR